MNPKWSPFVKYLFIAARCLDRNLIDSGLTPDGRLKLETEIKGEKFTVIQQRLEPIVPEKKIFGYEVLHVDDTHKREYVGMVDLTMKTETLVWPETAKTFIDIDEVEKAVLEAHEEVEEIVGGARR